jgi:Baculovirus LEF-11 protein
MADSLLTKSATYSVLRETINHKKHHFDTASVVSHVEEPNFGRVSGFINENLSRIFIQKPNSTVSVAPHKEKLNYLFNLPKTLDKEYKYCCRRNGFQS